MRDRPLEISLLLMLFWTLDKFINPEHAGAVYKKFYAESVVSGGS